ncbi:MAG: CpsD/CapB family tyrosine-protein kinase [Acutalibacteraceae bacterium]|nr:CpsD/CapB family tyrosine-protein kinase [Acutalibacteraceae bacterium]
MKNNKDYIQKHILTNDSPFIIKEAYKATRTNIYFTLSSVKGCKVIAFTSSKQDEGKSTTCINLAISFSEANNKVLVIDADMRMCSVHKLVGIENKGGLSNVLVGFTKLNEIITHTDYGFDVITAGPTPPNPSELLSLEVMSELIDVLKEHYDYIFIDTPPINVVSDALNIADCVSGYVVVVKNGLTTYDDVENIKTKVEFANSKIIGFILNAAKKRNGSSRYKNFKYDSTYSSDTN